MPASFVNEQRRRNEGVFAAEVQHDMGATEMQAASSHLP